MADIFDTVDAREPDIFDLVDVTPPPPPDQGVIGVGVSSLKKGAAKYLALPAAGIAQMAGEGLGVKGLKDFGDAAAKSTEEYIQEQERLSPTQRFQDISNLGDAAKFAYQQTLEMAPQIALSVAGGGAGMAAARAAVGTKAGLNALAGARILGGAVGGVAPVVPMEVTSIYQGQKEGEKDIPKAVGYGILASLPDMLPIATVLKRTGLGKSALELTKEGAEEALRLSGMSLSKRALDIAKTTGLVSAEGAGTEALQTVIEHMGSNQDNLSEDAQKNGFLETVRTSGVKAAFNPAAWNDIIESAAAGGVVGGVLGGGVHTLTHAQSALRDVVNKKDITPSETPPSSETSSELPINPLSRAAAPISGIRELVRERKELTSSTAEQAMRSALGDGTTYSRDAAQEALKNLQDPTLAAQMAAGREAAQAFQNLDFNDIMIDAAERTLDPANKAKTFTEGLDQVAEDVGKTAEAKTKIAEEAAKVQDDVLNNSVMSQRDLQPYEMSLLDYGKSKLTPAQATQITDPKQVASFSGQHIREIKAAIERGDAVPSNVLKEYQGQAWADSEISKAPEASSNTRTFDPFKTHSSSDEALTYQRDAGDTAYKVVRKADRYGFEKTLETLKSEGYALTPSGNPFASQAAAEKRIDTTKFEAVPYAKGWVGQKRVVQGEAVQGEVMSQPGAPKKSAEVKPDLVRGSISVYNVDDKSALGYDADTKVYTLRERGPDGPVDVATYEVIRGKVRNFTTAATALDGFDRVQQIQNVQALVEKIEAGKSASPKFARGKIPEGVKLDNQNLEDYAKSVVGEYGPKVKVVKTPTELPFDAPADAKGALHKDTMYLVSDALTDAENVREVIAHEAIGHHGLRGFFGDKLNTHLDRIHKTNTRIQRYAEEWVDANTDVIKMQKLSAKEIRYLSIEEAMARMAEEKRSFPGARMLVAKIQELLRAMGLDRWANRLEAVTDAQAVQMLAQADMFNKTGMKFEKVTPVVGKTQEPLTKEVFHRSDISPDRKVSVNAVETWIDRDETVRDQIVTEFLSGDYVNMPWSVVPAAKLKKVWSDYTKHGVVRDEKGLDKILDKLIENALRLKFNNEVSGHDAYYPDAELSKIREDYEDLDEADQAELRERVSDWTNTPDEQWRISDYGMPKIEKYLMLALDAKNPEDKLTYMDMALNVIHQRSDLASWFVEGGAATMSDVSEQGAKFSRSIGDPVKAVKEVNNFFKKIPYSQIATDAANKIYRFVIPVDRQVTLNASQKTYAPIKSLLNQFIRQRKEKAGRIQSDMTDGAHIWKRFEKQFKTDAEVQNFSDMVWNATEYELHADSAIASPWTDASWEKAGMLKKTGKTLEEAQKIISDQYQKLTPEQKTVHLEMLHHIQQMYQAGRQAELAWLDPAKVKEAEAWLQDEVGNTFNKVEKPELVDLVKDIDEHYPTLRGDYMPMMRFGDLIVRTYETDKNGELGARTRTDFFDSPEDARKFIEAVNSNNTSYQNELKAAGDDVAAQAAVREKYKDYNFKHAKIETNPEYRKDVVNIPASLVDKISKAAANQGITGDALEELKQSIEGIRANLLPRTSTKGSKLHREGVAGYERDVVRVYLTYVRNHALANAQLTHGAKIEQTFRDMRNKIDAVASEPDYDVDAVRRMGELADHLYGVEKAGSREKVNEFTKTVGKITFAWYLASPSVFAVQWSQPFMVTIPKMGARHGFGKAFAAYTKAAKQYLHGEFSDDKIDEFDRKHEYVGQRVTDILDRARDARGAERVQLDKELKEIYNSFKGAEKRLLILKVLSHQGQIDLAMAHNAGDVVAGATADTKALNWIVDKGAFFMQKSETGSRRAAAISAFELQFTGNNFTEANDYATHIISDTLMDFDAQNRGAAWRGNTGRILGQFQFFRMHMVGKLAQLTKDAIGGEYKRAMAEATTQEEKDAALKAMKEARKEFAYVMGSSFALAGAMGTPLAVLMGNTGMSALWAALAAVFGDDDDPRDPKRDFELAVREALGDTVGNVVLKGLPSLIGADISRRIGLGGMGDIIQGDPPAGLTPTAKANWYAGRILGPSWGVMADTIRSADALADGDLAGAFKAGSPKIMRDVAKMFSVADKGVEAGGKTILKPEDVSVWSMALMFSGINPMEVALASEESRYLKNISTELSQRRSMLIKHLAEATVDQDLDAKDAAIEKINKFSETQPMLKITQQELFRKIKKIRDGREGKLSKRELLVQEEFGKK